MGRESAWCALCALILGVNSVGCGDTEDGPLSAPPRTNAAAAPVTEAGSYRVGLRILTVDYVSPATGETRTIPVNVWYPTEDTSGGAGLYAEAFADDQVLVDATPAPSVHPNGYPVHVYSHGDQGFGGTSAFVMRHFASHGWVAVAPDHVNNTLFDNVEPRPVAHYVHRPLDITHSLNTLEAAAFLPSPADTARTLMSGHSFGCYTTWGIMGATYAQDRIDARCAAEGDDEPCPGTVRESFRLPLGDPRVVAAIPMAGGYRDRWYGDDGYRAVRGPMMFLSGSADEVGQAAQWERLTGIDFTWIDLEGGCHQSFALSVCETLEPALGQSLVDTYALAFGRRHILGDGDPQVAGILDGSVSLSARVSLRQRAR